MSPCSMTSRVRLNKLDKVSNYSVNEDLRQQALKQIAALN